MEIKKGIHHSPELEAAILGVCLLEKEAFGRVYGNIEKDCFYQIGNAEVFEVLQTMFVQGLPIDTYTVIDFFMRMRGQEKINSERVDYYIIRLTNHVVSGAHLEYHCWVIKCMWMDRQIIHLTHGGLKDISGTTSEQIKTIQDKLLSLQSKATKHDWKDMTELMIDLYRHQDELKKTGGIGISTGIKAIDKENGGFHPGQMIVIGARPSVGKSAFMGDIAINIAKYGKTVGIVSLEMSNNEIAARLASIDTDTDFTVLFRGLYRDQREAETLYSRIGHHTAQLKIYVSDKTDVNAVEIRAKATKLKALHGLDCLMIDYLQLINSEELKNRTRENEIAKISRGIKIMAKELNIPVIVLCQLNREITKRKGAERYPQLSDLRESGSLEQDADVVMFLHRDWMAGVQTNEQGQSTEKEADLVIRKWRNGKTNFIIPFEFHTTKMKFVEKLAANFAPVIDWNDKQD